MTEFFSLLASLSLLFSAFQKDREDERTMIMGAIVLALLAIATK